MDENTHKALLDQPGSPRRWIKTNPAGWFGFDAQHASPNGWFWSKAASIVWHC
jgi:hypothetical protein